MGLVLHEHPLSPYVHTVKIALLEQEPSVACTMPNAGSPLAGWLTRPQARPSVATAFDAASSTLTGFAMRAQLVASGMRTRGYRAHRPKWMLRRGDVDRVLAGMRKENRRFSREFE